MGAKELPESIKNDPRYSELLMPVDTNIKLSSVILSEENKEKISEFIKELKARELLGKYGFFPMNRILMYGDSGTGKTYLSKALTNYLGYTMLYVDIGAALNRGNVAENLTNIFRLGNKLKYCVIFLDECDSIGWNREGTSRESGEVRRATNNLFQLIDQMDKTNVLIGCTNMIMMLDPAFVRRFDMKMQFFRPKGGIDDVVRKFMRDGFTYKMNLDDSCIKIVNSELSVSYYEIQIVVERAMKDVLIKSIDYKDDPVALARYKDENGKYIIRQSIIFDMLGKLADVSFKGRARELIDNANKEG